MGSEDMEKLIVTLWFSCNSEHLWLSCMSASSASARRSLPSRCSILLLTYVPRSSRSTECTCDSSAATFCSSEPTCWNSWHVNNHTVIIITHTLFFKHVFYLIFKVAHQVLGRNSCILFRSFMTCWLSQAILIHPTATVAKWANLQKCLKKWIGSALVQVLPNFKPPTSIDVARGEPGSLGPQRSGKKIGTTVLAVQKGQI